MTSCGSGEKVDATNISAGNDLSAGTVNNYGNANSGNPISATDDKAGKHKEDHMSDSVLPSVTMTASAENTTENLIVKYEVQNHTDQPIYIWDLMIGYSGNEQVIDKDAAYIFFAEPKTIRLIRAELPLPSTFDIARKEIPYARILANGEKISGMIRLKHPVKENSPYYPPVTSENEASVNCSEINLLVGWTRVRPGMQITERTISGQKVYAIRGTWDPPHQEILQETMPVQAELFTYTTPFERMLPVK